MLETYPTDQTAHPSRHRPRTNSLQTVAICSLEPAYCSLRLPFLKLFKLLYRKCRGSTAKMGDSSLRCRCTYPFESSPLDGVCATETIPSVNIRLTVYLSLLSEARITPLLYRVSLRCFFFSNFEHFCHLQYLLLLV